MIRGEALLARCDESSESFVVPILKTNISFNVGEKSVGNLSQKVKLKEGSKGQLNYLKVLKMNLIGSKLHLFHSI